MKKKIMILLFLLFFFLIGCSAQMVTSTTYTYKDSSIYEDLRFSYSSMTYTDTDVYDIFYRLGNPITDFTYFSSNLSSVEVSPSSMQSVNEIFPVFTSIYEQSNNSFSSMLNLSSLEFNELANTYSISLTLTEVVAFNDTKTFFSHLQDNASSAEYGISKIDYIEMRLGRALTEDEITALDLLEHYYAYINQPSIILDSVTDQSYMVFSNLVSGANLANPPTEEELILMEQAYDIIAALDNQ